MAGTDHTRESEQETPAAGPAIVLVTPQLGENIGTASRAMANCGLSDLRLVRPRDGWPNPTARAAASGADFVLDQARIYDTTEEAVADLRHLYATSARRRDMVKPVLTPRAAAAEMRQITPGGAACGVLFGPERTGLENEDVVLAQALIAVPLNPAFSSLNLAQAVLLVAYEWHLAAIPDPGRELNLAGSRRATTEELLNLYRRIEEDLIEGGFLFPPEKTPIMIRNLRNIFQRADLTEQEVRTLHGMLRTLARRRNRVG